MNSPETVGVAALMSRPYKYIRLEWSSELSALRVRTRVTTSSGSLTRDLRIGYAGGSMFTVRHHMHHHHRGYGPAELA